MDSVLGVTAISESDIEVPDEVLNKAEYLTGVAKIGKRLILLMDIAKLLSSDEKTGLSAIGQKVEVRKRT